MPKNNLPLKGRKIAITRSKSQVESFRSRIEELGGEIIELPLIDVSSRYNKDDLEDVFAEIGTYSWLIFTSMNGVRYFFDFFLKHFTDIRSIGGLKIACIGKRTAEEVRKYHLAVDFIPRISVSDNFADELIEFETLENEKILVITGNRNRDVLVKKLEEKGLAIVDSLQVYETKDKDITEHPSVKDFREHGADAIVFTSASTVLSFANQAKNLLLKPKAKKPLTCSIGPITSEALESAGIPLTMEAKEHSLDGVIEVLVEKLNK